uniref:Integrase catalytic domain-containing protein n=1 Tax=Tanacetum cinerariifolium TaxID=118510 RepID=A0A6L2KRE9_TANCI|nr:hypothetical protein [Tanacetum cinerariifolium]
MPPKPDMVFNNAPNAVETDHPAFNVKLSPTKPDQDLSHTNRPSAPIIEDWVSNSEDEYETKTPQNVLSFVQPTKQVKSPRPSIQHVETSIPAATPKPASPKPSSNGKRKNRKACFVCKSLDHLIKDCDCYEKKKAQPTARNHAQWRTHKQYPQMIRPNPQRYVVPTAVVPQSKPVPITAVRPVTTVVPKIKVTRPRHAKPIITKTNSPTKRHINHSLSPKASNSPHRVTAVLALVVNAAQGMQGKWEWKPKMPNSRPCFSQHKCINDPKKELKFNLFSVSQMCDKKNSVLFTDAECLVLSPDFKLPDVTQVLLRVHRENNMYNVNLKNIVPSRDLTCLFAKATFNESNLWHRRLGHINFKTMNKLVKGLENQLSLKVKVIKSDNGTEFKNNDINQFCGMKGIKREFSVPRYPQQNGIAEGKNRILIEAARTMVLVTKPHNKTPYELLHGRKSSISFMRPFGCPVTILNTLDSLGKFDRKVDEGFLVRYSVSSKAFRVFNSRTCIVQETLHVNFLENKPNVASSGPTWLFDIDTLTKTMNYQPVTTCNQSNLSVDAAFDEMELEFDEKKPASEFNVSPSSSAQSKKHDDKTKREAKVKSPVESFAGFRNLSAEFKYFSDNNINEVYATGTLVPTVGQISLNITNTFNDVGPLNAAASPTHEKCSCIDASQLLDDPDMPELEDITYSDDEDDVGAEADFNNLETSITIEAMQEELLQFKMQKVWVLVDLLYGKRAIGTKWAFRNKKDKRGIVVSNKARLFAQGHTQKEGIDYEEVFALVARIEAIRLFLAYASFMGFMVYQIDVKSAFLYETTEEEVYVCQPPGFKDLDYPNKVYKVVKALYGLHQTPRAWYETLANYLLENGFQRGKIDQTLFIKRQKDDILLVQIYVDDIIFGSTNKDLCKDFEKLMKDKF